MGTVVAHVKKARRSAAVAPAGPALAALTKRIVKLAGREAAHIARVAHAAARASMLVHASSVWSRVWARVSRMAVVSVAGTRSGEALGDAGLQLSVAM
jgi:hypothetical protein